MKGDLVQLGNIRNIICNDLWDVQLSSKLQCNISLKILQLNICSVSKNFKELELYLNGHLNCLDVIILTETWVCSNATYFNLENFSLYYSDGNYNKSDGIIIYINNKFQSSNKINTINKPKFMRTKVIISRNQKINISSLYRSPQTSIPNFIETLTNYIEDHCNKNFKVLAGDANIYTLINNHHTQMYNIIMATNAVLPVISLSTRETVIPHHVLITFS